MIRGAAHYEPRAPGAYVPLRNRHEAALHRAAQAAPRGPVPENASRSPQPPGTQESGPWVREAMARLDASEREILMLREYEQLSYAEIAELLRIPVNTVRSRLFRARMALRQQLNPKKSLQRQAPGDGGATTRAAEGEA